MHSESKVNFPTLMLIYKCAIVHAMHWLMLIYTSSKKKTFQKVQRVCPSDSFCTLNVKLYYEQHGVIVLFIINLSQLLHWVMLTYRTLF